MEARAARSSRLPKGLRRNWTARPQHVRRWVGGIDSSGVAVLGRRRVRRSGVVAPPLLGGGYSPETIHPAGFCGARYGR